MGLWCLSEIAALIAVQPAGDEVVSAELKGVDDGFPKEGIRHDRVSLSMEQLVKAKAFVHFLETGGSIAWCLGLPLPTSSARGGMTSPVHGMMTLTRFEGFLEPVSMVPKSSRIQND